jgi:hypothetical protein
MLASSVIEAPAAHGRLPPPAAGEAALEPSTPAVSCLAACFDDELPEGPYNACSGCGRPVEMNDPETVRAVEMRRILEWAASTWSRAGPTRSTRSASPAARATRSSRTEMDEPERNDQEPSVADLLCESFQTYLRTSDVGRRFANGDPGARAETVQYVHEVGARSFEELAQRLRRATTGQERDQILVELRGVMEQLNSLPDVPGDDGDASEPAPPSSD